MTTEVEILPPPSPTGLAERFALLILQLGAIAVVLVAADYRVFELDRFFVPKELVLHTTALLAGLLALRAIGRAGMGAIDGALVAYLLICVASAAVATIHGPVCAPPR